MLNSCVSKLLHEFHLEGGKKDKNEEKLRVIRTTTRLILSDITSLSIDSDWNLETSTFSNGIVRDSFASFLPRLVWVAI